MNRLILLCRVQLRNTFLSTGTTSRKKRASWAGFALQVAAILYLSVFYSLALYRSLPADARYLGVYLMAAAGAGLVFFLGIPYSEGQLFGFRDYDFLMSLPISRSEIVAAKAVSFLISMYLYSWIYLIPSMAIYGAMAGAGAGYWIFFAVGMLFFPLVPTILSSLIGLLIKSVSSHFRHQNLVNNIFTVILSFAIIIFSFRSGNASGAADAGVIQGMLTPASWIAPQAFWYVNACLDGNPLYMLAFIGSSLLALLLFLRFASRTVLKVSAAGEQGYHVRNFRLSRSDAASPMKALFRREMQRFFLNFNYVMNMAFGMIMLVGGSIWLLVSPSASSAVREILAEAGGPHGAAVTLTLLAIGVMAHSSCITGVSISLEGKTLWILKTLPISTQQIFAAKAVTNIVLILVPSLLSLILISIAIGLPLSTLALGMLYLILTAAFVSMYGLFINLHFPKLDFDREIVVIKQSMSSMLSILTGMAIGIAVLLLSVSLLNRGFSGTSVLLAWMLIYLAADLILYWYLAHGGIRKFRQLG